MNFDDVKNVTWDDTIKLIKRPKHISKSNDFTSIDEKLMTSEHYIHIGNNSEIKVMRTGEKKYKLTDTKTSETKVVDAKTKKFIWGIKYNFQESGEVWPVDWYKDHHDSNKEKRILDGISLPFQTNIEDRKEILEINLGNNYKVNLEFKIDDIGKTMDLRISYKRATDAGPIGFDLEENQWEFYIYDEQYKINYRKLPFQGGWEIKIAKNS